MSTCMLPSVIRGGESAGVSTCMLPSVIRGGESAVVSTCMLTKAEDAGECGRCVQQGARAQDQREDCEREE